MPDVLSKSKLTLWIDKETKRMGKEWAKQHHESLSKVVSDYLHRLKGVEKQASLTPLVRKLSGILKGPRPDRESYRKHLKKKYLSA